MKFKKLKTANRGEIIESRNNAMRIALAFICALIAWFFVTMKFYPSRPKSYSGVTLSTELEADSQLEIMSVSKNNIKVLTVDVDFECSRYDYNSIKLGNLEAYIDTADITKPGKYSLEVKLRSTKGHKLSNIDIKPAFVDVELDIMDTKTVSLMADTSTLIKAEDKIFGEVKCDPPSIEIKGPSEKLKKVNTVMAVSDYSEVIDSSRHITSSRYILYDEEGKALSDVSKLIFSRNTVDMTINVKTEKEVPIVASFQTSDPNFDKTSISYTFEPDKITLAAESADSINDPFEIKVPLSDIDDISFEADYPINNAKLESDNIENVSKLDSVHFTLNGSRLASKELTLSNSNMHPMQIPDDDYDYSIVTESLVIKLIGPKELLNDITASDLNANVYLINGENEPIVFPRDVEITFKSKSHNTVWAVTGQKVNIRKTPKTGSSSQTSNRNS